MATGTSIRRERFRTLFAAILGVVTVLLLAGFVFSFQVAQEYARHNAQIAYLKDVDALRGILMRRGDTLFAIPAAAYALDAPADVLDATAPDGVSEIRALLAGRDRVLLHARRDGRYLLLHKGVGDAETARFLADPTRAIPAIAAHTDWGDLNSLTGIAFGDPPAGRFALLTAGQRGVLVVDVILLRLWPYVLGAAVLALAISYFAYRFAYRRYDEVARERARLSDFARASTDYFWEMDADLRFAYFSSRFTEVTGVPQEHLLGRTREEAGNPGADPEEWQAHLDALAERRPFKNFIHPRAKPDGRVVWLAISGAPYYVNGVFAGYRGSGSDITKQRETEAKLRTMKENAERANRAKSDFLAAMSHDLRTPLNAIIGFSQVIRDEHLGPISARYKGYLDDIHTSGHMLLSLISEVLDLSAIEAGRRQMDARSLEVAAILADCRTILGPAARKGEVELDVTPPEEPLFCHADETALKQVLQNLGANAIKFTPAGGRVRLCAEGMDEAVTFRVRDTGRGMSDADIARVVEPFEKGGGDSYVANEGWGLGLAIVRNLVLTMGGAFAIESEPGVGTAVTVSIPRAPVVEAARARRLEGS